MLRRRCAMSKRLPLAVIILNCGLAVQAHAETTHFMCRTEQSANTLGAAIAEGKGGEVAYSLLLRGECVFLREEIAVHIVQHGETFGTTPKVTVVGLSHKE